jgi:outer membrane biosynthesis protein TonB
MSRSKHRSPNMSQILTIGLLSFCVMFIVSILSYWLVALSWLKNIFKRKESKEKAKGTPHTPMTNSGESLVSSLKVEREPQPVATKVEREPQPSAPQVEPEPQPVATKVEREPQPSAPQVEPGPQPVASKVEGEPQPSTPQVESEPQPVATKVVAESDVLASEVEEAYCVKCRQKQSIQGARKVITQKGRHALEGTCPVCGTKLFRFIAREKEKTSG